MGTSQSWLSRPFSNQATRPAVLLCFRRGFLLIRNNHVL
nr:MAG TPA: hypothetical protein [Caudoviricetes sp.]